MKINGVSLRTAGKIYYYTNLNNLQLKPNLQVIVETARGLDIATIREVDIDRKGIEDEGLTSIIRIATNNDLTKAQDNKQKEINALHLCRRLVDETGLDMQLIDVQSNLDNTLFLFYFLAEHRIDFRELVKLLAKELHCRIELRQVGIRDEAKILGGYGMCGRELCCASYLDNFTSVSISMAKDQGLALNPQKISGMCGRLMCCLSYECEHYRDKQADMPKINAFVITPNGEGKVLKQNIMAQQVEVVLSDTGEHFTYPVEEVDIITNEASSFNTNGCNKHSNCPKNKEQTTAVRNLEDTHDDDELLVSVGVKLSNTLKTSKPNAFETAHNSSEVVIAASDDLTNTDDDFSSLLTTAPPERQKHFRHRRNKN